MPLFTRSQLHAAARNQGVSTEFMRSDAVNQEFRSRASEVEAQDESGRTPGTKTFNIFLSHSSLDAQLALALYLTLTGRGYRVYLDRIHDSQLSRTSVTRRTAQVIRRRMTQCDSLFVATTSNTPNSNWVPWELGFADGLTGKAAVIPIVESANTSFGGLSYFELYPTVETQPRKTRPDDLEIVHPPLSRFTWGRWIKLPKIY